MRKITAFKIFLAVFIIGYLTGRTQEKVLYQISAEKCLYNFAEEVLPVPDIEKLSIPHLQITQNINNNKEVQ